MSWPIPPGHVSLHRARMLLGRSAMTLDQFCLQLGIAWRGKTTHRYLSPAEFHRLRDHCKTHPSSYRSQRTSEGDRVESDPERRQCRDQEIARRIEAARRLKQRYPGVTIDYEWMIESELSAMETT